MQAPFFPGRVTPRTGHSTPAGDRVSFYLGPSTMPTANKPPGLAHWCWTKLSRFGYSDSYTEPHIYPIKLNIIGISLFSLLFEISLGFGSSIQHIWYYSLPGSVLSGNLISICSIISSNLLNCHMRQKPRVEPWGTLLSPGRPINYHLSVTVIQAATNMPNWFLVQPPWLYQ